MAQPIRSSQPRPTPETRVAASASLPRVAWRTARRVVVAPDLTLLAGGLTCILLYVLAVYGPRLAPHDQYFVVYHLGNNTPPFPPGGPFPLGSDQLGRDVLSWVLIGARPTLTLVAVGAALRLGLALPLGLVAGWRLGTLADRLLEALAGAASAVPAVVGALLTVLAIGVPRGWVAFAAGLTVFGWAAPMLVIRQATAAVANEEYVVAARALGCSERRVLWRHVLANVWPTILPVVVLQVAACLLVLTELGFLQLFLGGGAVLNPLEAGGINYVGTHLRIPTQAEWGGLLAQDQPLGLLFSAPWIVLTPLAFIATATLGLSALANGLSLYARRQNLGRLFTLRRAAAGVLILIVLALPAGLSSRQMSPEVGWAHGFDGDQAATYQRVLTSAQFGRRAAGSAGATAAAYWLAGRFATLGLTPAGAQSYLRPVALSNLLPSGPPDLKVQRGGVTSGSGNGVTSLLVPWSAGGMATGPAVFVGRAGTLTPGHAPRGRPINIDLSGKIAVLAAPTTEFPVRFVGSAIDTAVATGAIGVIVLDPSPQAPYSSLGAPGSEGPDVRRVPIIKASGPAAATLLAGSGLTLATAAGVADDPNFAPIPLLGTVTVGSGFAATPPHGQIVAGLLPGAASPGGLLLVVASYDTANGKGDGSGAAVLLELARMLQARPQHPETLFLALPGGPPGKEGLAAALAAPPLRGQAVRLAVEIDDVGGGGPLTAGAFSPDFQPLPLLQAVEHAAAAEGAPAAAAPFSIGMDQGGTVSVAQFTSLNGQALAGPAVAIAAGSERSGVPNAQALALAGRTAALLLVRAAAPRQP